MKYFKQNKYSAKRTVVDGITFDSIAESEYYLHLKYYEGIGAIVKMELQPKTYLSKARIKYVPDFYVEWKDGKTQYIDVKGFSNAVFNLKKKLWKTYGPGDLVIVKKKGKYFYEDEVVEGK